MTCTSFISAPLRAQRGRTFHETSICIISHTKARRRPLQKVRMEAPPLEASVTASTAEGIVREVWSKCEKAKFTLWLPYFDETAVYYDTLYPNPFVGKSAIAKHLKNMESALPPRIVFVLDDIAAGSDRVGARWHAETGDGVQIPFTRGASMYSFIRQDGKLFISEAWDFPETPVKLAGLVLPLLRAASGILRFFDKSGVSTRN